MTPVPIPIPLRVQIEQAIVNAEQLRQENVNRNLSSAQAKARAKEAYNRKNCAMYRKDSESCLAAIAGCGGRATSRQIADRLGIDVNDVTRQTKLMLADGLLRFTTARGVRVWEKT